MSTASSAVPAAALALAAAGLAVAGWLAATQPRYGHVDPDALIAGYPPTRTAREAIEAELAPMRQKLAEQQSATAEVEQRVEAQKAQLSDADRALLQLQITTARERVQALDQQLKALESSLLRDRLGPVTAELGDRVRAFGEAEGYAMIWTSGPDLAYASGATDLTDDVLAWIAEHPAPTTDR
jgi:Skp family chaperone for outer membrane proteins